MKFGLGLIEIGVGFGEEYNLDAEYLSNNTSFKLHFGPGNLRAFPLGFCLTQIGPACKNNIEDREEAL